MERTDREVTEERSSVPTARARFIFGVFPCQDNEAVDGVAWRSTDIRQRESRWRQQATPPTRTNETMQINSLDFP